MSAPAPVPAANPPGFRDIRVRYSSVDGYGQTRTYRTLPGARRFAQAYVGKHPEMGSSYAVSGDGVGKVEVQGCTLSELFPPMVSPPPAPGAHEDEDADQRGPYTSRADWDLLNLADGDLPF